MTDEEYLFRQTEVERKKLGYGDRHKKRGGGRYVRLPSDHMTKKEREAMNGECVNYQLGRPVTKEEFYTWPVHIQREYLQQIVDKYHPKQSAIAAMLRCSAPTVCKLMQKLGVRSGRTRPGRRTRMDREGWTSFVFGTKAQEEAAEKTAPAEKPGAVETAAPKITQSTDLHNIALLLQSLAGTGAKLTIEVTL